MPDYLYLLENQLSADQQYALRQLREAARQHGTLLFLTGDAVRDLTSGHSVRDLEVVVHGNALKMQKTIEDLGGVLWGHDETLRSLYLCFPGTVRVDLISAHRLEYPKPGQAIPHFASIQEDLRRRDFTANAMAISLNEGSFGLLMDPMNGAADIEARTLRLVSNYGFLEEPANLIRATRYRARLGWEFEQRTGTRFGNACEEGLIEFLSEHDRSRELEQIAHEEEGLKVLEALENEGWLKVLFPAWGVAKADAEQLSALHELAVDLLVQGVHADTSAAQMRLLTARMAAKDVAALKKLMLRPGFVEEWNNLDTMAAGFAKLLLAKENAQPSLCYQLFMHHDPEAVLWLGFTTKDKAIEERFNLFLKVWPEVRQKIPFALLAEMRITPELADYNQILEKFFLELIDGHLQSTEEQKAFLEPYSPPAPVVVAPVKRSRAKRVLEAKVIRSIDDEDDGASGGDDDEEEAIELDGDEEVDLDELSGDDDSLELGDEDLEEDLAAEADEDADSDEDESDEDERPVAKKAGKKPAKSPAKAAATKTALAKASKATKETGKGVEKTASKPAAHSKPAAKAASKAPAKAAVAHKAAVAKKPAVKKPAAKSAKKH